MTAMLSRFLTKRVFVGAAIGAVLAFFVFGRTALAPLGVMTGCFTAVLKTRLQEILLRGVAAGEAMGGKLRVFALLSPLAAFAVLLIGMLVDIRLFAGLAIGFLSLPVFIMVNAFTEKIGLTKNRWGGALDE